MKTKQIVQSRKPKLVNVTMAQELIAAIDEERDLCSRAAWIRGACVDKLPHHMRRRFAMRRPGYST